MLLPGGEEKGLLGGGGCGLPLEGTLRWWACVLGGSLAPSLRRRARGLGGCSGQVLCLLSCEASTELSGGWENAGKVRVGSLGDMRAERERESEPRALHVPQCCWTVGPGPGGSPLSSMTLRTGSVSTGALGRCRGTQHHAWEEGESGEWGQVDASENYPEGKLRISFFSWRACGLSYRSQVNFRVSEWLILLKSTKV